MGASCTFPACPTPATTTNRAGKETCEYHRAVVVVGSYLGEGGHRRREGEDG